MAGDLKPLPRKILVLREKTISLFVSNLPASISSPELKAMFCRAGRIFDSSIPKESASSKGRGFAFVRFGLMREAELGIELARGRSWGGRRINMQLSNQRKKVESSQLVNRHPSEPFLGDPGQFVSSFDNPWFNPLRRVDSSERRVPYGESGSLGD
eukprot:TRINITY_DN14497_c1_g2_i2.p1 TRINITY_DN14497_c1_g2~~TRINITY_DN14497_c1_g2_i2.p1  ORF type:complete len:156 (+),score=29.41 TRINITY_DN14497_c1_g2_i2:894-1361(+)